MTGRDSARSPKPRKGRPGAAKPIAGLAVRQAALGAFRRVLDDRLSIDDALDGTLATKRFRALDDPDRRFARAILVTTFRHFGAIDLRIDRFLRKPVPKRAGVVRHVLRLGLAQLDHLDVPDHAAVSSTVELARSDAVAAHFVPLVNGVMRSAARDRSTAPGRARTVPAWLWRRWRASYGEETARRIIGVLSDRPPLDLSVHGDGHVWAERLGGVLLPTGSIRLTDRAPVAELPGYSDGAWWVQDAAAALPARLLGAIAGRHVLDLCAAPGGKTAQLAAAGARVTAVDASHTRVARLEENLGRLGLDAETVVADVLAWKPDGPVDAVLLDAPCSATGTIRRHPEIPYTKTEDDIAALAGIQGAMLDRAADWLKPGGTLIYCTCSLEPEEGEERVRAFLEATPVFEPNPVTAAEIGGLEEAVTASGAVRTLPFMGFGTAEGTGLDGFYIARLVRTR